MMQRIDWQRETSIPYRVAAVFDALRFGGGSDALPDMDAQAVYYLNRNQLTLIARHVCGGFEGFYRANVFRLSRLQGTTRDVISELERAGIQPVLLKGFARAADYMADPDARMHYDIDLFCPEQAHEAEAVLRRVGFAPLDSGGADAAGHLAPLARPTTWKWRDDFFDLETPVHVELHEVLWTPEVERFGFSGLEQFWARRERENGKHYYTLSRHDTLAFRSLHLLRHLLRGDTRAAGVYEIAWFLHQNRFDDGFWTAWDQLYSADLRLGQAACFALAQRWFGCEMHEMVAKAVEALPPQVSEWMELSAASPVESFFVPGKSELGLHFALIDALGGSRGAKLSVALRRLLPLRHSGRMWEGRGGYLARLGSRAVYHARALAPTLSRLWIMRRRYTSIEKRSSN
jgi:hypothetical protein